MVHEAVEALGNLSQKHTLDLIQRFNTKEGTSTMVYETAFLADKLIRWNETTNHGETEQLDFKRLKFKTNDPAPPFNIYSGDETTIASNKNIKRLEQMLLNKDEAGKTLSFDLFERYRALFTLRELNSKESLLAICQTLTKENMDTCGALLKHEVAYVLAQMEDVNEHSVDFLLESVLNDGEAPIVRHEALIAVGEMIDDKSRLEHLLAHKEDIVSESCQVALRLIDNRLAEQQWEQERAAA